MNIAFNMAFNGNCEAAFQFYEQNLAGVIGSLFRFKDSPASSSVPADWQDKILHGNISIGNVELAGSDLLPHQYEHPKGIWLLMGLSSEQDIKTKFNALAQGGEVLMPPQKTFWSPCYAMVTDRFGIPWKLNCGT